HYADVFGNALRGNLPDVQGKRAGDNGQQKDGPRRQRAFHLLDKMPEELRNSRTKTTSTARHLTAPWWSSNRFELETRGLAFSAPVTVEHEIVIMREILEQVKVDWFLSLESASFCR